MKAALFYGGKDIRVAELADLQPGADEVVVRVRAAGICGSDLHPYRSPTPTRPAAELPYQSGHELAGEILALGAGVHGLTVGQRVGVEPRHLVGCGRCLYCRRGDYHLCHQLGQEGGRRVHSTGFAQHSVEPANKVYPLPAAISFAQAALLDAYACAVHALHRAPTTPLDRVVVLGAGTLGLTAAELYKIGGAKEVIVCGTRADALAAASAIGADRVINVRQTDPVQALLDITDGHGADIVVEAVGGRADTLQTGLQMAAQGGIVLVIGSFSEAQSVDTRMALRKEVDLRWSWSYALWRGVSEFQIALDLMAAGKVRPDVYLTHTFGLDQIGEGFQAADDKASSGAIKVIIEP